MPSHFQTEQWLPLPAERIFRFFADPENLPRISPPQSGARLTRLQLVPPPGIADSDRLAGAGSEVEVSIRLLPFLPLRARWTAVITEFVFGSHFRDVQIKGPFRKWDHLHQISAATRDGRPGALVRDVVEYQVGYGWIGAAADRLFIRRILVTSFAFRHRATEALLGIEKRE